jgi:MFS family permease
MSPLPYRPAHARPGLGARFHALTAAVGLSSLGDGLALVAVPLLAAQFTDSPLLIALTYAAQELPWLLVALPAGALVDRLDRRRVAVMADLARAGTMAVLAAVVAAGVGSLPILWIAAFALGSLDTLATGAAYAVLPRVVPERLLGAANGRLMAVETAGGQLIGPAVAGGIFVAAAALPFALDAASFVASAAFVALALAGV